MLSLLYNDYLNYPDHVYSNIIEDLMLDKVFDAICPDIGRKKYFLNIISTPMTDKNVIYYRQNVLKEFLTSKPVLIQLIDLFTKFKQTIDEYNLHRKKYYGITASPDSDAIIIEKTSKLQTTAFSLKKLMLLLNKIFEAINPYHFTSEGLCRLRNRLRDICKSESFNQILQICSQFEFFDFTQNSVEMLISFNDEGRVVTSDLISAFLNIPKKQDSSYKKLLKSKSHVNVINGVPFSIKPYEYNKLVSQALKSTSDALDFVINQINMEFKAICEELIFYKVATEYIDYIIGADINISFPEICTDQNTYIENIYDLFLVTSNEGNNNVIANDFMLSRTTEGVIISGDNNSGKTVYLRSVATSYLFAQAGLPVPAKKAIISICRNIFIQMASSEKKFVCNDEAGRFEGEVKDLADIINKAQPNSIVILNEIFQTTDYNEGAQGLYYILEYLTNIGVKWILVTHLRPILDMFRLKNVLFIRTKCEDGFRLEITKNNSQ